MGTRIKTRLRIAAHPFFNFFYNTIHLPHTTPRLALDADESVCCVRPLCLTLSSFASLRVWAMLNLFLLFFHFTPPSTFLVRSVTSSSISTRYFDDILQAYPDKDNSPSHDGNVCIHPPPTRSAPSWPSGAKPSYVWLYTHVLRRISSAKSITVKQVPKDPFRRHLQKVRWRGLSRRWTSSRFDSAVRRPVACGMLDGRGIRESRRGYVGYATWTSGDVAS